MGIYAQQKVAPKEESEATAQKPVATSGVKLTELKTSKPVDVPKHDAEKKTNKSLDEEILYKINTQLGYLKEICEMEKRRYPNWLQTYELNNTATGLNHLKFDIDTNATPIVKIVVLAVGGGLNLSLNGSDYFSATIGDIYEGEFRNLHYTLIAGGSAFITAYARIDK